MRNLLNPVRKFWLIGALVGVMGMSLAACGGDTPSGGNTPIPATATSGGGSSTPLATNATTDDMVPTTAPATTPGGGMSEYQVMLKDYVIDPKTLEVPAGKVKFTVTNTGATVHNLVIVNTEKRTPNLNPGDGPATLEADLTAGTYKWICDIPGHTERGMTGELTVK